MIRKIVTAPWTYLLALVCLDQATKHLVRSNFYPGETLPVTPFFQLTYLTNTGVAFSMFQGGNIVFAVFTFAVLVAFFLWYRKHRESMTTGLVVSFVLITSGAAGNLIDRVVFGRVTDFLDFSFGSYHWPSFNVADSCVSTGAVLLFVLVMLSERNKRQC